MAIGSTVCLLSLIGLGTASADIGSDRMPGPVMQYLDGGVVVTGRVARAGGAVRLLVEEVLRGEGPKSAQEITLDTCGSSRGKPEFPYTDGDRVVVFGRLEGDGSLRPVQEGYQAVWPCARRHVPPYFPKALQSADAKRIQVVVRDLAEFEAEPSTEGKVRMLLRWTQVDDLGVVVASQTLGAGDLWGAEAGHKDPAVRRLVGMALLAAPERIDDCGYQLARIERAGCCPVTAWWKRARGWIGSPDRVVREGAYAQMLAMMGPGLPAFEPKDPPEENAEGAEALVSFVSGAVASGARPVELERLSTDLASEHWARRECAVRGLRLISGREFGYRADAPDADAIRAWRDWVSVEVAASRSDPSEPGPGDEAAPPSEAPRAPTGGPGAAAAPPASGRSTGRTPPAPEPGAGVADPASPPAIASEGSPPRSDPPVAKEGADSPESGTGAESGGGTGKTGAGVASVGIQDGASGKLDTPDEKPGASKGGSEPAGKQKPPGPGREVELGGK